MTDLFGSRIEIAGPAVEVDDKAAQQLALAVHELATNAVKYGSLSTPEGTVELRWSVAPDGEAGEMLDLVWRERGGPPPTEGGGEGFGTKLLTLAIPHSLGGTVSHELNADGLVYRLSMPLKRTGGAPSDTAGDAPILAAE
jgi:two-component sensor histidine kinase